MAFLPFRRSFRNTIQRSATITIFAVFDSDPLSLSLFLSQPDRSALVWRESIDRNEVRGNLDIKGRDIEMESFIRFVRAETPDRWNFRIVLFVSNHSVSTVFDKFFTPPSLSLFLFFFTLFFSLSLSFPFSLSLAARTIRTKLLIGSVAVG